MNSPAGILRALPAPCTTPRNGDWKTSRQRCAPSMPSRPIIPSSTPARASASEMSEMNAVVGKYTCVVRSSRSHRSSDSASSTGVHAAIRRSASESGSTEIKWLEVFSKGLSERSAYRHCPMRTDGAWTHKSGKAECRSLCARARKASVWQRTFAQEPARRNSSPGRFARIGAVRRPREPSTPGCAPASPPNGARRRSRPRRRRHPPARRHRRPSAPNGCRTRCP